MEEVKKKMQALKDECATATAAAEEAERKLEAAEKKASAAEKEKESLEKEIRSLEDKLQTMEDRVREVRVCAHVMLLHAPLLDVYGL